MKSTIQNYEKMVNYTFTDPSKYDLNARIQLIIQQWNNQLDEWEREAREMYWPESINKTAH